MRTAAGLTSSYHEAHEKLARRMITLGAGEEIDSGLQDSISGCIDMQAKVESQLSGYHDTIIGLKGSLARMGRRYATQVAIQAEKINQLDAKVRDTERESSDVQVHLWGAEDRIKDLCGKLECLKEANEAANAQLAQRAFGSDIEYIKKGYEFTVKDLREDIATMQQTLVDQELETLCRTNLDYQHEAEQLMRDFDLARILQNERDAALIKIAALEDRFATELDLQPLVCDPEDSGVGYSTSEKRMMGMIKDAMPRLLRKGEKVDPQPEDF